VFWKTLGETFEPEDFVLFSSEIILTQVSHQLLMKSGIVFITRWEFNLKRFDEEPFLIYGF
jgi:hypothetical protein